MTVKQSEDLPEHKNFTDFSFLRLRCSAFAEYMSQMSAKTTIKITFLLFSRREPIMGC
jgi:hypothetical protein